MTGRNKSPACTAIVEPKMQIDESAGFLSVSCTF